MLGKARKFLAPSKLFTPNVRNGITWSLAGTALLIGAACISSQTGKEGNFQFRYSADDNVLDFNKPVAVGAKLDLRVYDAGDSGKRVTISDTGVDDPEIFVVTNISGNTLTIEGKSEGRAELEVTGTVEGETEEETDYLDFRSAVPDILKLRHLCLDATDREGFYMVGEEVFVPFDMELSDGQPVIGYGYHPVEFEPSEGLQLDTGNKDQQFLHLNTAAEKQAVTIKSTIDSTTLTMNLVTEAEITDVDIAEREPVNANGGSQLFQLYPKTQGKNICQSRTTFSVSVKTDDVCSVTVLGQDVDEEILNNRTGFIEVEGKAAGDCIFDVTYPDANNGEGLTKELSLTVELNPNVGTE